MVTPTARVLLAEDHDESRRNLADLLRRAGFDVFEAATGSAALALLRHRPDVAILDVHLPDASGLAICRAIKADPACALTPVMHLSGRHITTEERVGALEGGADAYLTKPVDPDELIAQVRVLLRVRRAEEALLEREREYRLLFETNPQPMWVFDAETLRFLAVNDAAIAAYGYGRDEFLRMTVEEIRPPEDVPALHAALARGREGLNHVGVVRHRRKDGKFREAEVTVHPTRFGGRPARLAVAVDVTERRQLEAQLIQSQKMEAVGRLAGGVAHDFNNALTVILGTSDLLLGTLPGGGGQRDLVREIQKAAEQAAALTRQLLAFSRKAPSAPRVLDLNAVVKEAERLLRRLVGPGVELAISPAPGPLPVKAEPNQIEQVLMNLAVNARDAMPGGGKLAVATRHVRGGPPGAEEDSILLSVADTGCGMDEEVKARLFDPFFTTKPPGQGTGLGLSVVYGIVRQAGGRVEVESAPGAGATFRVYLPRSAERPAAPGEMQEAARVPRGSETVLLAEDEDAIRNLAKLALRAQGYTVLDARDGNEALARLDGHAGSLHLLVTDLLMPRMGGRELAESVARLRPGVKVLYLSGYPDDLLAAADSGGEAAFLQKPFTPATLARKVREVLDRGRAG